MGRSHKYIEKHRSKSGKWVYKYADKSDWVEPVTWAQNHERRERNKKARISNAFKRSYKIVENKARYTYSQAKKRYDNRHARKFVSSIMSKTVLYAQIRAAVLSFKS